MEERRRVRARRGVRYLAALMFLAVVGWLMVTGVMGFIETLRARGGGESASGSAYILRAEIVDETGAGVTASVRTFAEQMEVDLAEYGYRLERLVLPEGKMREVHLYLAEREGYIKVRTDREAGAQAEDVDRMMRYLDGEEYEYVDVRVEGKAYWK